MLARVGWTACLCLAAATAYGQYSQDFEGLNGSPGGTLLTGQDGFYLPPVASSVDHNVYTYAGNTIGIPANPGGGDQFEAGVNTDTLLARAQRDVTWGSGAWTIGGDVCGNFTGTLPAAQNLGSMSANQADQITFNFIMLATWVDVNTATTWNVNYVYFNAAGTQTQVVVPDPAFQNLPVQKWYRWSTRLNYDTNRIEEVTLTDIDAGTTAVYQPTDWYMRGGSGGQVTSTSFRLFTGGIPRPGNVLAWDNVEIAQAVTCDPCDTNCDGVIDAFDIEPFINVLLGGPGCASCTGDVNGDMVVDAFDIEPFINCLVGP